MSVDHKDTVPVTIHYSLPMPPRVIHVPTHFSLDETPHQRAAHRRKIQGKKYSLSDIVRCSALNKVMYIYSSFKVYWNPNP